MARRNASVPDNQKKERIREGWRTFARVVMCLVTWALITGILFIDLIPNNLVLQVGDVADEDIRATRTVEDTVTTEALRDAARAAVADKFYEDTAVTDRVLQGFADFCTAALQAHDLAAQDRQAWENNHPAQGETQPEEEPAEYAPSAELMQRLVALLPISLTQSDVHTLIAMPRDLLLDTLDNLQESVQAEMHSGIKEAQLSDVQERLRITHLEGLEKTQQSALMSVITAYVQANFFFDAEATALAREKAAAEVTPVVYQEKQNIVQAGEVITAAQYAMLEELGLVQNDSDQFYWRMGGLAIITAVMLGMLWANTVLYERDIYASLRRFAILNLLLAVTVGICWATKQINVMFLPSALAAMMISILLNHRCALLCNVLFSMLVGLLAGAESSGVIVTAALPAVFSTAAAGTLGIFLCHRSSQRGTLVLAGFAVGAVYALVNVGYDLMLNHAPAVVVWDALLGLGSGVFAAILSLGLLPVLEMVFRVVTPMKLMELSNTNHPLLKRLMMEAPGTYQHSLMVGNLAEAAANAIGANALLVRTAAFYHDVGKLMRPTFFKENQMSGVNPLDAIEPELAAKIIVSHTVDGYELARSHRIPPSILDLVVQHHGDTAVAYFYYQAKQRAGDTPVNEADFRYAGPNPTTREAAVLMLADSVEAAVRSLSEKTPEKIAEMVDRIVNQKLNDGQFRTCAITLSDLDVITSVFRSTLNGIYHERIAYPTAEKK